MLVWTTGGESHGPALTAVMTGLPAGLKMDFPLLERHMDERRAGYGRGGRMAIESDEVLFEGGVRAGITTGAPLVMRIPNRDWVNWRTAMDPRRRARAGEDRRVTAPRPGHADLAGALKFGHSDIRNVLERASARETAARVALGAVAQMLLARIGVEVESCVDSLGGVAARVEPTAPGELGRLIRDSSLRCPDPAAEKKMISRIDRARKAGDTLGGTFVVTSSGLPVGLGTCMTPQDRLDARLAAALVSIPAVKGVEFGLGFGFAAIPGSEAADEIFPTLKRGGDTAYVRNTNRAGGIEGGMSNGEPLWVRAVMKPIPTLMSPLATVDLATGEPVSAQVERSDVCAAPAASVVGRAMAALTLAAAARVRFGGDTVRDFVAAHNRCQRRVSGK